MAVNFPTNPNVGDTYTEGGATWMWNGTAWVNANAALNYLSLIGNNVGRNYIHNAAFLINQRAQPSYTTAGGSYVYTMDRWMMVNGDPGDSGTVTYATPTAADRAAIGDESIASYASYAFAGGAGAGNNICYLQRIEDVRRLSNKTVTLSFWAYSPTGLNIGLAYIQNFGTGGSPSPQVQAAIGVAQLTAGWQRYSFTFTFPSIAGLTLGTNNNSSFSQITFYYSMPPANTGGYALAPIGAQSGTINLWGVQLEVASQMTPFEHRDYMPDLALCQRFFLASNFSVQGYNEAAANDGYNLVFPVTMRVAPTLVPTINSVFNCSGSMQNSAPVNVTVNANVNTLGTFWYIGNYTASADL